MFPARQLPATVIRLTFAVLVDLEVDEILRRHLLARAWIDAKLLEVRNDVSARVMHVSSGIPYSLLNSNPLTSGRRSLQWEQRRALRTAATIASSVRRATA